MIHGETDPPRSSGSQGLGSREQTAVDGVNDGLRANLPTAKIPAVEALDGIFAARYALEFQVDVALGVGVERNVHHVAVLFLAFGAHVVFEFFDPGFTFFSGLGVSEKVEHHKKTLQLTRPGQTCSGATHIYSPG